MSPRISVCIPSYNSQDYICETVDSILGQTFSDFELIVVDDGSTDETVDRLESYQDSRLRVIRGDHVGAIENWNRCGDLAEGEFIKFVASDDTLAPKCLQRQLDAFSEHPQAAMVTGLRNIVDERGRTMIKGRGMTGSRGLMSGDEAIRHCVRSGTNMIGEPTSVLIRSSEYVYSGGWRDTWPYMMDLEMWFRVLQRGDLVVVPKVVATFRVHPTGWTSSFGSSQSRQARELFAREKRRHDGTVTGFDWVLGAAKAEAMQIGRRAVYGFRRNITKLPWHSTSTGDADRQPVVGSK
jgi:glycosyltransferase involved in cell wall biosynthesis